MNNPTIRGHWPLGKRRNADVKPPRGFADLGEFLEAVRGYCEANGRGRAPGAGAQAELADELGVSGKAVWNWLRQVKWPSQDRVDAMAAWYRRRLRSKPSVAANANGGKT